MGARHQRSDVVFRVHFAGFADVLSCCEIYEKVLPGGYIASMKVAIQGERGAFSHQAALQLVPRGVIVACQTSADVFDAVDSGRADCAVIPVENTLAGPVAEHLDLLVERDVFVRRQLRLRIEHNLIASPETRLRWSMAARFSCADWRTQSRTLPAFFCWEKRRWWPRMPIRLLWPSRSRTSPARCSTL